MTVNLDTVLFILMTIFLFLLVIRAYVPFNRP